MIDVERARADTPGCETRIHFNNAGASLQPRAVIDAVAEYQRQESELGGYEAEVFRAADLARAYDSVAALIGASRDEIAITDSATRGWDLVFYSLPWNRGDRVLVSHAEYASNYIALLQIQKRVGIEVIVVEDDDHGQISLSRLASLIDDRVKLIAITHVPTSGGLVNPAEEVGEIARAAGVLYLLDACQSVGQLPVDVRAIGCDFLSATGRKFLRGPRGTGFLYVNRERIEAIEPIFLDGHAATWTSRETYEVRKDARRFESYEANLAARLGLGAAAEYAHALGIEAIAARVGMLAGELRRELSSRKGIAVTDRGQHRCGIVTFTVQGCDVIRLRDRLRAERINMWVSPVTFGRLDLEPRGLTAVARASVHYYNTEGEVRRFVEAVELLRAST